MGKFIRFPLFILLFVSRLSAQLYPPFQVTVNNGAPAGYYFLNPVKVPNPGGVFRATQMIMDESGHVVWYRRLPPGVTSSDFKLQPNGWMSYSLAVRSLFLDSTFTVVDTVSAQNGIFHDGHDIQILPNGHFLLMGFENLPMDLSAYPFFNQNGSPGSPNAIVKSGVIQELDTAKNVVFEWHAADHYDFGDVDPRQLNSPVNVDWTHFNSLAQDADGNILLSTRHFNEITKISRTDGSIIWRLGGKANQFEFLNDSGQFLTQHDARRIANGNLTLFDNGFDSQPLHPAAAKEYQLDETALTAELVWSYVENPGSFSRALGSVQRLDNGATLVNYGMLTDANLVFNVPDTMGNKAFEISFDDSLISYRTFYYPSLPWQLHRPEITCIQIDGQYFLEAESGHAGYLWSTGATSQTIPVGAAGTFFVFVPKGLGFVSSEPLTITNPADPCGLSSSGEPKDIQLLSVFPNPVKDIVTVRLPDEIHVAGSVEIVDLLGKKWMSNEQTSITNGQLLEVSLLPPGVYLIRVDGYAGRFVKL
ncbi:MAG TPA: aryl-sulfate sulfotransferase [Saprospiraceae bacterium]|nr:aryl-sulfate sulfotransferase [Saprospiraceae bacterium]